MRYTVRPLDASTWDAFAELVERNNGIYGGCWCVAFHSAYQRGISDPRTLKEQLVRAGHAHAALVFDEQGLAQGWCQYGSPGELELRHGREYRKDPPPPARWRITCSCSAQRSSFSSSTGSREDGRWASTRGS